MRIEQLTFTRFLAAMAIVVFHYGLNSFPFNLEIMKQLSRSGSVGVSYFYILSGFVMILAYGHKETINLYDYLKKRFARIYPVYILAMVLLFAYQFGKGKDIDYPGMYLSIGLIQSWFPKYALSFNTPAWSLSVELLFYVSFPFLFNHIYSRWSRQNIVIFSVLFWIISQAIFLGLLHSPWYVKYPSMPHFFLFYTPILHLNEFIIGNLAGILLLSWKNRPVRNYDLPLLGLGVLLILTLPLCTLKDYHNGLMALIFVPFILLVALNNGYFTKISSWKPMVILGEASFGIYILQKPVFWYLSEVLDWLGIKLPVARFYILVVVLISVAILSYFYIEVPMRNLIRNWTSKKQKES